MRYYDGDSECCYISPLLWESLLDAAALLSNSYIGYTALALLTGGSTFNPSDAMDPRPGCNLELDPVSIFSSNAKRYFENYRAMLAYEHQTELTRQRTKVYGSGPSVFSGFPSQQKNGRRVYSNDVFSSF